MKEEYGSLQETDVSIRMHRLMDRMHRIMASRPCPELARKEFFTLHVLREMTRNVPQGVQMSALARELEISQPAASKTVQVLEERGYVVRQVDPASRRNILVRPTEEGIRLETEADQQAAEYMRRVFARLGHADAEEFFRICTRLAQIAEEEQNVQKGVEGREC